MGKTRWAGVPPVCVVEDEGPAANGPGCVDDEAERVGGAGAEAEPRSYWFDEPAEAR